MFRRLFFLIGISFFLLAPFGSARQAFAEVSDVRDPTRPAQLSNTQFERDLPSRLQGWTLTSTLISPRRSIAIINGQVFHEGQSLEGSEILAIEPGAVQLQHDDDTLWLYATAGIKKKPRPCEGKLQ
jgi:hypothetical protein